jgi:hypothetical protein
MNNMTGINGLLITASLIGLIGLTFFVFVIIRLIQNLKFTKLVTGQDFETNVEILNSVFRKLYGDQFLDKKQIDNGLITSNSGTSMFSWGEINTAICQDNIILINSRPTGQPITLFENRLNIKRIINNIEGKIKPSPQQRTEPKNNKIFNTFSFFYLKE